MPAKMDTKALEKLLTSGALSAQNVTQIAESIEALKPFKPTPAFPIGIVVPDGVRVRVSAKPDQIADLVGVLAGTQDPIRSWRVFPIGIVAPERFEIEVDIGMRLAGP